MLYWYTVWVVNPQTKGNVDFMSPKLDFTKGDVIELNGEELSKGTPGFDKNTIYELEINKVVWTTIPDDAKPPYQVAELQVVYVQDLAL